MRANIVKSFNEIQRVGEEQADQFMKEKKKLEIKLHLKMLVKTKKRIEKGQNCLLSFLLLFKLEVVIYIYKIDFSYTRCVLTTGQGKLGACLCLVPAMHLK